LKDVVYASIGTLVWKTNPLLYVAIPLLVTEIADMTVVMTIVVTVVEEDIATMIVVMVVEEAVMETEEAMVVADTVEEEDMAEAVVDMAEVVMVAVAVVDMVEEDTMMTGIAADHALLLAVAVTLPSTATVALLLLEEEGLAHHLLLVGPIPKAQTPENVTEAQLLPNTPVAIEEVRALKDSSLNGRKGG